VSELSALANALVGQYEIDREIGRGGMGIVYLARDLNLDRPVAIKTLPAHLAGTGDVRERFLREARTAAHLSHPSIVPIHRADEIGGQVFFVMGYVDGESLAHRLRIAARMRDPAIRVGGQVSVVTEDVGGADEFLELDEEAVAAHIHMERVERLRLMPLRFGDIRLAQRRHPQVDERRVHRAAAESARRAVRAGGRRGGNDRLRGVHRDWFGAKAVHER